VSERNGDEDRKNNPLFFFVREKKTYFFPFLFSKVLPCLSVSFSLDRTKKKTHLEFPLHHLLNSLENENTKY